MQSYFEISFLKRDKVELRDDPSIMSITYNSTLFNEQQDRFILKYLQVSGGISVHLCILMTILTKTTTASINNG
ncbi:hypothetical protein [Colwellia sp. MB3u-55]|uniref:hypothetical protein n=1 Tax=Colwellia sp. MB3u-55 TaxID=2759810 RepID=UPI0015F4EDBA|nr:hypothetical protein [Colwellia sp. MB3u-55]MBA6254044.1 hypothetical protein [Colwellia sp. MB3u-55]